MNTTPERTLYSLKQITVAALLGTPFPGFWLASRNLNALGQERKSRQCLAWGAGLTVANFVLALILPERPPGPAFSFALSLFLVFATRSTAKELVRARGMYEIRCRTALFPLHRQGRSFT
jgi:hypothetical protein